MTTQPYQQPTNKAPVNTTAPTNQKQQSPNWDRYNHTTPLHPFYNDYPCNEGFPTQLSDNPTNPSFFELMLYNTPNSPYTARAIVDDTAELHTQNKQPRWKILTSNSLFAPGSTIDQQVVRAWREI